MTLQEKPCQLFKLTANDLCYGQTATLLSKCLFERLYVTSNGKEKSEIAKEGMEVAKGAISVLSKLDAKDDLLLAFSQASIQAWYIAVNGESEEDRKNASSNSVTYASNALELSNEVNNVYSKAMSRWGAVWSNLFFIVDIDVALKNAREMLEQATTVRDNYLRGVASYMVAEVMTEGCGEANPDKRRRLYEEIIGIRKTVYGFSVWFFKIL